MKSQIWNQDQTNFANVQPVEDAPTGGAVNVKVSGTGSNPLAVSSVGNGTVSTANSSSSLLGIDESFVGSWEDVLNYVEVLVIVQSDHGSAVDGLLVEWSNDGVGIAGNDTYTILANRGKTFSFPRQARYVRVTYTNDGFAQTGFGLATLLNKTSSHGSTHRINDSIVAEDDARLVKVVLTAQGDDGTFRNVPSDVSGSLKVNAIPYTYAIAGGDVLNHGSIFKFGTKTAIAANTPSTLWEGPTDRYVYPEAAIPLSIASTSAEDGVGGTGTRTITVEGLDANYNIVSEAVTLNGLGVVVTTKSYIRVFRAYGGECGTSYTNVGIITMKNAALSITYLTISPGDGQTLMALWTVPAGKRAFLVAMTASSDTTKGATVSLFVRAAPVGAVLYPWQIKFRAYISGGSNRWNAEIPFMLPEKTDIEIRFSTPSAAGTTSGGGTFELWYEDI